MAQQNQRSPGIGVLPAPVNQSATPEIPNAYLVISENPIASEVPVIDESLAILPTPPVRTLKELYDKFRRMKALEFKGLTNLIKADNWLVNL
ncbi:hypothetical protein TIFTF001_031791 [Ficus carica]|uniref:Uncharacterized protein n=1 Tax=Ficus carica TaxID=3494 RepID=A0AA88J6Y1_FICCA|nr:hypothetical protein TIFTF001_031791 [Ficus carica]